MNIWICDDCRRVGFYWDKTEEQVRAEHICSEEHTINTQPISIPDATGDSRDTTDPVMNLNPDVIGGDL
jgi:hypothetical protein